MLYMDLPREKGYPPDSVQCDGCGGWGCIDCDERGWLTPAAHPKGRRCESEACTHGPGRTRKPLPPGQVAVYCCDDCADNDA